MNNSKLKEVLDSISPMEQHVTDVKMLIAKRIAETLSMKGLKKTDLAKALGNKRPSEVTRWLSGTQNMTVETLAQIEYYLGISLFNLGGPEAKRRKVISFSMPSANSQSTRMLNEETVPDYGIRQMDTPRHRTIMVAEGEVLDIVFE